MPHTRITAGICSITGALRFESASHRCYVTRSNRVSVYRVDGSMQAIDRQQYHTRAGALGYVKGFFNLPIIL